MIQLTYGANYEYDPRVGDKLALIRTFVLDIGSTLNCCAVYIGAQIRGTVYFQINKTLDF